MSRRAFLASTGLAIAGTGAIRAIAGPFNPADVTDFPVPADKKLDPLWVRSLFERGAPTIYRSAAGELEHIGMPIGGICTGQLYLGGDGRLWHWDIFNQPAPQEWRNGSGPHYAKPAEVKSPIEQGFAIRVVTTDRAQIRPLDQRGFRDVRFRGEYPIGLVEYRDVDVPVVVNLEAFSPFVPLNEDDSGLPATVLRYTVRNIGDSPVEVELGGWLQNGVCLASGQPGRGQRENRILRQPAMTVLECRARANPAASKPVAEARPDIVFDDFESETYDKWSVTGTAFGDGPIATSQIASYQGDVNAHGQRVVNSHSSRRGGGISATDSHIGSMTSKEFTVERHYIRFRIGGGAHPGQTCVNLLVDGAVVRSAAGHNNNRMRIEHFDVREFAGKQARLQVMDGVKDAWGNIGVDEIVFTDGQKDELQMPEQQPDDGTMALALLGNSEGVFADADLPAGPFPIPLFKAQDGRAEASRDFGQRLIGAIGGKRRLAAGEEVEFTFVLAWHFDGLWWDSLPFLENVRNLRRFYGTRFRDAADVVRYVAREFDRLLSQTRLWRDTWYDSTLPYWLLDRTLANISTLATATCYRFDNGRFYGWEGNYCCGGTCTHVWQYAQAVGRLFPALERSTREMIDFGLAFDDATGIIHYRAEAHRELAVDGQAGTILRVYREHQMSKDDGFLRRIWPRVRKSVELLMSRDTDHDGLLDGAQYNTLDAAWYGQIAWISSHYLAAVRAGEKMAVEMGDAGFAERCRKIVDRGGKRLVERLYNGEYFIHIPDPDKPQTVRTGDGCHIDQLFGQSWAHQVGLGRIVPLEPTLSALRSLWRYNFAPDVGPYRLMAADKIPGGRWYAMPGEGGLLMCTWPKGGMETASGGGKDAGFAGYFNECMTGFEYQVAAHMIWEGMVQEGLAITRMIHDRYHARKRNPWNEIECGDHYARAMASYGVFLAVCGFEYHGPQGYLAFAPRMSPDHFRSAFTSAEGWGTFEQNRQNDSQTETIVVRHGRLTLRKLAFDLAAGFRPGSVAVSAAGQSLPASMSQDGSRVTITLDAVHVLKTEERLDIIFRA
ncbi:MAG TPA: GH116 family glycosyl hydrolase [Phycisphaerae bacterium]|nr:GH116 family glycosyl hydrolase [Phycisphaerae bacterium]